MIARRRRTNSNSENKEDSYAVRGQQTPSTFVSDNSTASYNSYTPPMGGSSEHITMTCRDRTNEFMSAVKSMQSRQVSFTPFLHYIYANQQCQFMQTNKNINKLYFPI